MKSIIANWVETLLGVCLLLGAGVAQAVAPSCFAPESPSQTNAMTVILGSPSAQWTAVCNSSPLQAGYVWKVQKTGAPQPTIISTCTGVTCVVPAANLNSVGDYNVTVAATNTASGLGGQSSNSTITVNPVQAVCLPTYGAVDLIDPVIPATGKKVTLTANCNPGPKRSTTVDGYVWRQGGVAVPQNNLISPTDTAPAITVKLPADGTLYTVSNSTAVRVARGVGAVYSGVPYCTLESVSPAVSEIGVEINSGASAVLMPTCDAATSIDWYVVSDVDIPVPAPAGGIVTPKVTTKYYVVGSNAYGSSGSNEVTVTVNPAGPPVPTCSPAASPVEVGVNGQTTLTANCSGATGFAWASASPGNGLQTAATSSTVTAIPTSSGTKTYTITGTNGSGSGTASVSVIVSNLPPQPKSDCGSITPATADIAPNTATSFNASCNNGPAAAGYSWKVQNGTTGTPTVVTSCTGSSCAVPGAKFGTAGTYYVTVTNNNGQGAGVAATATVTVSATPLKSDCGSITPATTTIAPNTATSFNASCNNGPAATGYSWKVKKGATGSPIAVAGCSTGSSCNALGSNFSTAGTYYVTVTNNNGQGPGIAATATVTVSTTPTASDCTGITPGTTTIAPNTATSFNASCNNGPAATGYSWKVKKGATGSPIAVAGCSTGSSCNALGSNFSTAGTYYVTVTNNNGQGVGAAATATVTATTGYVPVVKCPPLKLTNKAFDFASPGVSQHVTMSNGQAFAFKFTTDSVGKVGTISTGQSTKGAEVKKYVVVSETACDFSYVPYDTRTGCGSGGSISFSTGTTKIAGHCSLKPSTTYYFNVRNENAALATRGIDTCPASQTCGYVTALTW